VINNVGGSMPKDFLSTTEQEFEGAFHFNVTTAFALTKAAVPHMQERGGAIVAVSVVVLAVSVLAGMRVRAESAFLEYFKPDEQIRIDGRKIRVVRVPMPHHHDDIWRSHTNVVYLNGLLLVPTYPATDDEGAMQAVATYQKLLPTWRVQPIDAEALATLGGALHCVTMNLAGLERLPEWKANRVRDQ